MIALTKENQDTDVLEFVVNREEELTTLTHSYNGNTIGHGSSAINLGNNMIYIYNAEVHQWVEFGFIEIVKVL